MLTSEKLTMSEQKYLRDGMTYGTGALCRFKAGPLPGGGEAYFVNIRGVGREPIWRVEGKEQFLHLKQHCDGSEVVLHFADGASITIDVRSYARKRSGQK